MWNLLRPSLLRQTPSEEFSFSNGIADEDSSDESSEDIFEDCNEPETPEHSSNASVAINSLYPPLARTSGPPANGRNSTGPAGHHPQIHVQRFGTSGSSSHAVEHSSNVSSGHGWSYVYGCGPGDESIPHGEHGGFSSPSAAANCKTSPFTPPMDLHGLRASHGHEWNAPDGHVSGDRGLLHGAYAKSPIRTAGRAVSCKGSPSMAENRHDPYAKSNKPGNAPSWTSPHPANSVGGVHQPYNVDRFPPLSEGEYQQFMQLCFEEDPQNGLCEQVTFDYPRAAIPRRNVPCAEGVEGVGQFHKVEQSFVLNDDELIQLSLEEDRLASPSPQSIQGTSGLPHQEEDFYPQSSCSTLTRVAHCENNSEVYGALPTIYSPNSKFNHMSRPSAQLGLPQQSHGAMESLGQVACDPFSAVRQDSPKAFSAERRHWPTPGESDLWPPLTEHLHVLGTFDFPTRVFPILTRLKGMPLEEAFTLEELHQIGNIPVEEMGRYLWYLDGQHGRQTTREPPKRIAQNSRLYHCYVSRAGRYHFQIEEEKNQASNLLQRVLGFDRVFKVFFEEGYIQDGRRNLLSPAQSQTYRWLAKCGIFAGLRRYQYFAHKSADKSELKIEGRVKCYFICTDSRADADLQDPTFRCFKSVADARSLFMHIHQTESIAKYIARMQLVLSKTMTVELNWSNVNIIDMEDLRCKDDSGRDLEEICTDGTGFISTDFARMIPTNIVQGSNFEDVDKPEEYPSLTQVRIFNHGTARKGTLLAHDKLPPNTIKCYKSMLKVGRDSMCPTASINSFDVVNTSRKPKRDNTGMTAKLSQDLILMLNACKVPESFFLDLVKAAIEKSKRIFSDRKSATDALFESKDDHAKLLLRMVAAQIPLNEPFLYKGLLEVSRKRQQDFTGGRVDLPDSFYLMGTADPSGTLKPNQVLVYRAPGKHFGDLHVFEATWNPLLEAVGSLMPQEILPRARNPSDSNGLHLNPTSVTKRPSRRKDEIP